MADKQEKPDAWKALVFNNILPMGVIKTLNKAVEKLSAIVKVLTVVLRLLAFFISAFNSFSAVLATFIKMVQAQVNKLGKDIANTGIYVNVLVPPDFSLKALTGQSKQSQGGFEGFLSRLRVSINNSSDKNAPNFSDEATVGGLILLLDTETLYDFFKGMEFLTSMFDFMDLFPLNTKPPPPLNLRGSTGYFLQPDNTMKLGVKLEWDAPNIRGATNYRLSRSMIAGGKYTESHKIPTKLVGPKGHEEEGIIQAAMIRLASGAKEWPLTTSQEYDDKTFNLDTQKVGKLDVPIPKSGKPKILSANPVNGSGSYIDYDIDPVNTGKYYYVVESGFPIGLWGPRTPEIMVPTFPKNCISPNLVATIEHPGGIFEMVSGGSLSLGQWSSIQVKAIIPFMPKVLEFLNKYIDMLLGALKTNSKSFTDFIKGILDSIEKMKLYLDILIGMILAIENFFNGLPLIGFLNISAKAGGTENFLTRVTNATRPERKVTTAAGTSNERGFSGISGYTLGIVFVYGTATIGLTDEEKKAFETQIKTVQKAFDLIIKILS